MVFSCEKQLVCVNDKGEEKDEVGWWEFEFIGICRYPKNADTGSR